MVESTPTPARLERDLHGIGRLVLEKGLASRTQVQRCLDIQRDSAESGVFLKLGEIFVREGLLSPTQVQTLLALQHVRILICVRCFAQFNAEDWSPDKSSQNCPKCAGALVEATELKSLAVEDTVSDMPRPSGHDLAILDNAVRQFANHEILGEISRGGMGIVYKARQRELDRIVALKVLLAGGESSQEQILRFQREARAVAKLKHPNIVAIHEIGEHRGIHYFSMDYVPGVSLEMMIGRTEVPRDTLLGILSKVCRAVQVAHEAGVLHRDLKPSNILVTRENEPYLIDFGIAHCADEHDVRLTRQGYIFGSPLYMAPEYVSGKLTEFSQLCDVYALGVILYQVIAGVTPFEDVETMQVLSRILKEEARPVEDAVPDLHSDLSTICAQAIHKDPRKRYQTAAALASDLERFLAGEPIAARPPAQLVRLWHRHHRRIVGAAAVAAGLVAVGLAWYLPRLTQGMFDELASDRDQAQRDADEARRQVDHDTELLASAAKSLAESGKYDEALAIADALAARRPGEARHHALRARILDGLGRVAEADAAREQVRALGSGSR